VVPSRGGASRSSRAILLREPRTDQAVGDQAEVAPVVAG
jgi:hypothetical protein